MTCALIISTYNWPEALSLCLQSVAEQSRLPDEIIIADDGSREPTRQFIEQFKAQTHLPIRHIWHPDEGFRLAAIRNRAMAAAESDYIIQIDGDIILHRNFVEDHLRQAQEGFYVVGSRVLLGEAFSQEALQKGTLPQITLYTNGLRNRMNSLRSLPLSRLFGASRKVRARGCNMSFFRKDIIAINGYNEDMVGWGEEDTEMVARLHHNNIGTKRLKFAGIAYHIFHKEASRSSHSLNLSIKERTLTERTLRCQNGIDKYLQGA
ncbi:MAG: glycosyltransferase family 2 protein [Alistipes sp.]|nr:glycosyltransferase family 2 protein [Alistipes sp.]